MGSMLVSGGVANEGPARERRLTPLRAARTAPAYAAVAQGAIQQARRGGRAAHPLVQPAQVVPHAHRRLGLLPDRCAGAALRCPRARFALVSTAAAGSARLVRGLHGLCGQGSAVAAHAPLRAILLPGEICACSHPNPWEGWQMVRAGADTRPPRTARRATVGRLTVFSPFGNFTLGNPERLGARRALGQRALARVRHTVGLPVHAPAQQQREAARARARRLGRQPGLRRRRGQRVRQVYVGRARPPAPCPPPA